MSINLSKQYEIALQTRNFEIDLFWRRSNYFAAINTAVAAGFFPLKGTPYSLVLCFLGITVAICWFLVNLGSKYWQSRWERRLAILEQLDENAGLFNTTRQLTDEEVREMLDHSSAGTIRHGWNLLILKKPSVSLIATFVSLGFVFFWLLISITNGLELAAQSLQIAGNGVAASLTSAGLLLDIIGVVLVFLYGLNIKTEWSGLQAAVPYKGPHDKKAILGMALLVLGFVLQLVGAL